MATQTGRGIVYQSGNLRYIAAWPDEALLDSLIAGIADEHDLAVCSLPKGVRIRRTQSHIFAFNYSARKVDLADLGLGDPIVGTAEMPPASIAIWTKDRPPHKSAADE